MSGKLTDKQQAFVSEYLIDLNATQAAIRAGYSENTAAQIAAENLTKPNIQKAIAAAKEQRNKRTQVDSTYVLNRLIEIDQMDVADILDDDGAIKAISDWPAVWRKTLSGLDVTEIYSNGDPIGVLKKIKWPDKLKNLELLGKHVDVQAFKDKVEHEGQVDMKPVLNITLQKK